MLASRLRRRPVLAWWVALAVVAVTIVVAVPAVDAAALRRALAALADDPAGLVLAFGGFGVAFVLRAIAWRRVLPRLPFGQALAGIHLALGGNHVLPARLGEVLRVTSVVRRAGVPVEAAAASTVTLRAADLVALALLAGVLGPGLVLRLGAGWAIAAAVAVVVVLVAGVLWLRRLVRAGRADVRLPGAAVAALTLAAWVLEAVVIHRAAAWAGVELAFAEAVLVTALTVAGQVLAVAPGGIGTYEAAGTAALAALGVDPATALAVVVTAHALKTAYALVVGAIGAFVPTPGFLGRLRLPRPAERAAAPVPDGPVVLFAPAYDEEASVGDVVRRAPATVHGREVRFLVIDDGSADRTVEVAEAAGAEVVRQPENLGLGAAVRRGFAEAVARGAAVVVFLDADGEYAPEELDRMTAPILAGEADYVIGSRFDGDIERMLPHRRLGNRVLTHLLRFVSRVRVNDGQSGYRALSRAAATEAEIVHDYNYAQVLTLDLLAKGFRYLEVPISYRFRETGGSFVRLGRYLRNVVPAVHREINGAV